MRPELSWALWRKGYFALPQLRARSAGADVIDVRELGRRAVAVRRRTHVERFFDEHRGRRTGAVPAPLALLRFGRGAVHGLDGQSHRDHRERFLQLLDETAVTTITESARTNLVEILRGSSGRTLPLFDVLAEAYGAAVLEWAGVELDHANTRFYSHQLAAIVDGFGFHGSALPRAVRARRMLDGWAERLVLDARAGRDAGRVIATVASYRDRDGRLLPERTAGAELLSLLRPTVAVAHLGAFAAMPLAEEPVWRDRLVHDDAFAVAYAHEVHRAFSFVPALVSPEVDERDLVPQGGGPLTGHRCPGEALSLALVATTAQVLAGQPDWHLTEVEVDRTRIPPRPRHRVEHATVPREHDRGGRG